MHSEPLSWAYPWRLRSRLLCIIFVRFSGSQHGDKLVRRTESASAEGRWCDSADRFQLLGWVGAKIDLRGLNAAVSEPESDLPDVMCCLEHQHRTSVSQGVR